MSDDVVEAIRVLPDEQALEAGQLLAMELGAIPDDGLGDLADDPLLGQPLEHVAELAELARVLLISAATNDEWREAAERSVEGAGRKQFVLGGLEIVALVGLLVAAYRTHKTGGVKSKSRTTTSETRPDGAVTVTINEVIEYDTSDLVGGVIGRIVKP